MIYADKQDDGLDAMRGCLNAMIASVFIWAIVAYVIYKVFVG